jgi:cytoskeleton-associated protein 5
MIKRLLNDNNFNVILTVLKLIATLAKGLQKNFNHSIKILFPLIINKLKEKKNQMI